MSPALHDFHFLQPAWLLGILVMPVLLWWLLRRVDSGKRLERVADAELLPLLMASGRTARRLSPWLLSLLWLLTCVTLAGPAWQRLPTPVEQSRNARVMVLSLADSMLATDLKPDRLARARFKIRDLLEAGRDAQNALVAYAGQAFVVAPLTADSDTVINFLSSLKPDVMPVAGDRADRGINKAVELLHQAGFEHGDVILVADHAGDRAIAAAGQALQQGIHVSVLGVGTDKGAPVALDDGGFLSDDKGNIVIPRLALSQLRAVAKAGGGTYRNLGADDGDVQALIAASHHAGNKDANQSKALKANQWRDQGPLLLLLLVPLAALGFRRGWLMLLALALVLPTGRARAGIAWSDLWRNHDQQAAHALASNKPEQALKQARSNGLRGSAAYRNGDFKNAASAFAKGHSAQSQYNLGNALARQGQYKQAMQAWDRALKMDPDLADARANRKAVADWLARQHKSKPSSNPSGKKPDKKNGKSGSSGQSGQQGKRGKQGKPKPSPDQGSNNGSGNKTQENGHENKSADKADAAPSGKDQAGSPGQKSGKAERGKQQPSSARSSREPEASASTMPAPALSSETPPKALSREQAQRQQSEKQAAQQAVRKALDKQLQKTERAPVHRFGTSRHPYDKALSPAMRQSLERVPDDPGGLLRRKFMLEYQQRQQQEDGS
ncbi:MAG: VWA domain-containing protein [Rhodanobacteraceae bacterium]